MLVGTKSDLRADSAFLDKMKISPDQIISNEQGNELAKKIKAVKYVECSARTGDNLKTIFEEAVKAALFAPKKKKAGCALM
jgi:GTPase SAR1 family protein